MVYMTIVYELPVTVLLGGGIAGSRPGYVPAALVLLALYMQILSGLVKSCFGETRVRCTSLCIHRKKYLIDTYQ